MPAYACHLLLLPSGERMGPAVVRTDADGWVRDCRTFRDEEPCTEWWGGVFVVLPADVSPQEHLHDMCTFLHASAPWSPASDCRLWQVGNVVLSETVDFSSARFRQLGGSTQ